MNLLCLGHASVMRSFVAIDPRTSICSRREAGCEFNSGSSLVWTAVFLHPPKHCRVPVRISPCCMSARSTGSRAPTLAPPGAREKWRVHICTSHGQLCARAHCSTARCPPEVARGMLFCSAGNRAPEITGNGWAGQPCVRLNVPRVGDAAQYVEGQRLHVTLERIGGVSRAAAGGAGELRRLKWARLHRRVKSTCRPAEQLNIHSHGAS
jgi:hypothetical protein